MSVGTASRQKAEHQPAACPLQNLDGSSLQGIAVKVHLCGGSPGAAASRQLEKTCASRVRMRTTPPRHSFSLATIELDLLSAAHRVRGPSSETPSRLPHRHTHMSPCAARAAGDRRTTSLERLKACLLHKTCLSPKSPDSFHAVTGRASGAKRSGPPRSLGYGRRFTDRPAGRED
jgi:hypothetical protein